MDFVGSYTFNRGQTFAIWKGKKSFRASVELLNVKKSPLRYIVDRDYSKILLRAMSLIREDAAKDRESLVLRYFEGETLPLSVKTEDQEIKEITSEVIKEDPSLWRSMLDRVKFTELEELPKLGYYKVPSDYSRKLVESTRSMPEHEVLWIHGKGLRN